MVATSGSGHRLCRHSESTACSSWCHYRPFTWIFLGIAMSFGMIIMIGYSQGGAIAERMALALLGIGVHLAICGPFVIYMNRKDKSEK